MAQSVDDCKKLDAMQGTQPQTTTLLAILAASDPVKWTFVHGGLVLQRAQLTCTVVRYPRLYMFRYHYCLVGGLEAIVFGSIRWCVWSFRSSSPLRLPHLKCLLFLLLVLLWSTRAMTRLLPPAVAAAAGRYTGRCCCKNSGYIVFVDDAVKVYVECASNVEPSEQMPGPKTLNEAALLGNRLEELEKCNDSGRNYIDSGKFCLRVQEFGQSVLFPHGMQAVKE